MLAGPITIVEKVKTSEGENVTLDCDAKYDKHDWSRDDEEGVTNERRVLVADNSKLQITEATISDSGDFVCDNGPILYIFKVEVEGRLSG